MKGLIALFLLLPLTATAAEITCKKSPALTGQCRMVKGSLGLTQGAGATLLSEDGTQTLIKAPPDSNADIATPVMQNWLYWQSKTNSLHTRITGSFELCPLPTTDKPTACINSGSHITVDKSDAATP